MNSSSDSLTLITGATSGIGRETAIHLSKTRRLLLHGRNADRTEETKSLCENPAWHACWTADLTQVEILGDQLTEYLLAHSLTISGLVHSAGMLKILPMRQMELKHAIEMFQVNFFSCSEIIRILLKNKINKRSLRNIVFISSIASNFGARGFNAYCASKGALDSFMRALAVELAPEIRVNSILPGGVETKMTRAMLDDPETAQSLSSEYPLGLGSPKDIADAVEFLLSDRSKWMTGHQMIVDGGRSANITA